MEVTSIDGTEVLVVTEEGQYQGSGTGWQNLETGVEPSEALRNLLTQVWIEHKWINAKSI